jgi:4-alpha-glucanotransferase
MKVHFYIRFHTVEGQSISVYGNCGELGINNLEKAIPLQYLNQEFWHGSIEIDAALHPKIQYKYLLNNIGGYQVIEGGNDRIVDLSKKGTEELQLMDTWNHAGDFENVFFTSPFTQSLLVGNISKPKVKSPKHFTHIFKIKAPLLKKNEVVFLSGNHHALGDWKTEEPVLLTREGNWWTAKINLQKEGLTLQYKYGVYQLKEKKILRYEDGPNRLLHGDATENKLTILHDGFIQLPNNTWKGAGIAIPVFSLRSKSSFGVGEFTDIELLVNWAKSVDLKMVQILPVNDTTATNTWKDSYPYAAISAFALHPIYLNLAKVAGKLKGDWMKTMQKKQKELNELTDMDYDQVMQFKMPALKELYLLRKEEFLADPDYEEFFKRNKHWLAPYAAFCYLRDKNKTADFSQWKIYSSYDKTAIEKYVSPRAKHYDEIAVQYFIQYHLHLQLKEATEYAHKNGIILKGDIPIGIYRHSCDAWMAPELYNMDQQAGAPPDDFAVTGQNWGFPTYNWKKMAEDGFAWWKQRFEQMNEYFDAFRIDHILGFFRIWSIPIDAIQGIMGSFSPSIPVHKVEFSERNILFDHERYTKPFINEAILHELGGKLANEIRENYFQLTPIGRLELKEAFNTQRKVEQYFSTLEKNDQNDLIQYALNNIISNVILFEVDGSKGLQFHFRFGMDQTSSFKHLEWHTQEQLKDLYVNYFFRRQDDFWMREAMHKLPALKESTNMMVCGEDLGMVPGCVPMVMKQLGILALEIQRMPKDSSREFFHPDDAPYLSVVTPSTHDMSTIRGWWEEDREKTQRFFNLELGQWGEAPALCETWISKAIIQQHLYSPAMWSVFQLQDLMGMHPTLHRENPQDEQINVPANPNNYWKFRMHFTLEHLIKEKAFNKELKDYIELSGRSS